MSEAKPLDRDAVALRISQAAQLVDIFIDATHTSRCEPASFTCGFEILREHLQALAEDVYGAEVIS